MMLKTNSEAFFLDFLGNNPAFEELFRIIGQHNDSIGLKQVTDLLTLRNIDKNSSVDTVRNTVRWLGINLPRDLVDTQIEHLRDTVNSLARYSDVQGTSKWQTYLAFAIQSHITSHRLYTNDYQTFYTEPKGTKLVDGGTWYKTTHVEIEVGHDLINRLDMSVVQSDKDTVTSILLQSGRTEQFANAWFYENLGCEISSTSALNRMVRMAIFHQRVKDLYYQWCPVEEVIEQVKTTIPIEASLMLSSHVVLEPKRYASVGKPIVKQTVFNSYSQIQGGSWFTFGACVEYSDGTERTVDCYAHDHELIIDRRGMQVYISEPMSIERHTFNVSFDGAQTEVTTQVYPLGIVVEPMMIELKVPTLYGSSSNDLEVWGTYPSGRKERLTDSGSIKLESTFGLINGSSLVLPHTAVDNTTTITATYIGQALLETSGFFTVTKSILDLVPDRLVLEVPDVVTQGQDVQIKCWVIYNDYSKKEIMPLYESTAPQITIVEGTVKCGTYRDNLSAVLTARYSEGGYSVSGGVQVTFRAPKPKLARVSIEYPDTIEERQVIRPVARAIWVTETATQEQIENLDPLVVISTEEVQGVWTSFSSVAHDVEALPDIDVDTGEFTTPSVGPKGQVFGLSVKIGLGTKAVSSSALIKVNDRIFTPEQVSTSPIIKIESGSTCLLPCAVRWNTGKNTLAKVSFILEYIPSQSAWDQALADIENEVKALHDAGQNSDHIDRDPDWSKYITLELTDSNQEFTDPMNNVKAKHKQLYFAGRLHGSVRITLSYTYNDVTITSISDIQLVPERSVVDSVRLIMPNQVNDRSRTFVQLEATYSNGAKEFVDASNWNAFYSGDSDNYTLIEFLPAEYTGMGIVNIAESVTPTTFKEFLALRCSSWPVFASVSSIADLESMTAIGAIMAIRKSNEVLHAEVWSRYYRVETKQDLIIVPTPLSPINTIEYSRVEGAVEFMSSVGSEGYALVNTYLMPGYYKDTAGNVVEGDPYTYELEVSSDWSIVSTRTFTLVNDLRVFADTDLTLATIDGDGYLTPISNSNAELVVRATFDDGFTRLVRDLTVYMTQSNTYLTSMYIQGQQEVWDISSRNVSVEFESGSWYIPYTLDITMHDETQMVPEAADWSIGDRTDIESVSIDSLHGKLYIGESQLSDALIVINAEYSERSPLSDQVETVYATRDITLRSTSTITSAALKLPDANINPNETYNLVMDYTRRDGRTASSEIPDSSSVNFRWSIEQSVKGFVLNADGTFQFIAQKLPQEVVVSCELMEQRTHISDTVRIVCPGVGYPTELEIVGYSNIRDDSTIELKALLSRGGTFAKDDVTTKVVWNVCNSRGDVVAVPGVSVTSGGQVTVARLLSDLDFGIRCTYVESDYKLDVMHDITAISSYPLYGTAAWGISTIDEVLDHLTDKLRSDQGGTFVLSPGPEEFGYFAVRADYGSVEFKAAADSQGIVNPAWVDWTGANWPVTGDDGSTGPLRVELVYDNLTDQIDLYRTDARAFGIAVLTSRYLR